MVNDAIVTISQSIPAASNVQEQLDAVVKGGSNVVPLDGAEMSKVSDDFLHE